MVDVRTQIVIERSLAVVSRIACDPDQATRWYENIESVEWRSPRPLAQGTRVAFVAKFLGRRLAYTYEITEYVEHGLLVMRTAEGPFPMETRYEFERLGPTQTRVSLQNRGEPAGFSRVVAPFMALAMRRANQRDLVQLKRLVEGAPSEAADTLPPSGLSG